MIKKLLFVISLFTVMTVCHANVQNAGTHVLLQSEYVGHGSILEPHPKAPIKKPSVYIEGNIITSTDLRDGGILQVSSLIDNEENIVYSDVVLSGVTSWQLPTNLNGEYLLKIIYDDIVFWGYINL